MLNGASILNGRFSGLPFRYILLSCLFLILLLLLIIQALPNRPHGFPVLLSKPDILRPTDLAGSPREWKPWDDQAPPAHEPIGLGTLRDVREANFYRGGTSTIEDSHPKHSIYDPYPSYNSQSWRRLWKGTFHACQGPRGTTLDRRNPEDMVLAYRGTQKGNNQTDLDSLKALTAYSDFPYPMFGSYSALGLDGSSCTTRFSRLGAYGYDDLDAPARAKWDRVNWGALQSQCRKRNSDRYISPAEQRRIKDTLPLKQTTPPDNNDKQHSSKVKERAAVILRAWHDMTWTENTKQYIRSLVMELSLHSGAEYEIFLLTHVKDNEIPLHTADAAQHLKDQFIPREFWDMTVFFNEETLKSWYPKVQEHLPLYQHLQPVQIFSTLLPEFDYVWQLEMDARFTGHAYHFLERAAAFAKKQPRKYLWERNAHFYIPGAHDTYEVFKQNIDKAMVGKPSVWGPAPPSHAWKQTQTPIGPIPPVPRPEDDNYTWGVDEEADLITFLPHFDSAETTWVFNNVLFDLPPDTPRRVSPVTMGRYSRLLLGAIHEAQSTAGLAVVSEMTAPSFALWHGLKAVHVPHPIYADGKWMPKEIDRIVNKGSAEKMNGGSDSIWNWDHKFDHILYRMSYMFTSQAAEDFYRRWLGYEVDMGQYTDGSFHQDPQGRNWFDGGELREDLYGPLCFPPMLLHPVKNTGLKKGPPMAVPV
ncbi:DUF3405 domain-containing protein [Aspergillus mulundensis]|uniref:Uncharacterized protein n=1 Tax=Aspergillus mulundensis TaxID=1810919 RepID=A0A3D8RQF8_9EURO|nr:Uncharacterized protein DSM5745_06281 [Aspergillus mulundensis]RDW76289.1 Uncharacterized protein DSM5745_06281 [Aspergillus mulundensis]